MFDFVTMTLKFDTSFPIEYLSVATEPQSLKFVLYLAILQLPNLHMMLRLIFERSTDVMTLYPQIVLL